MKKYYFKETGKELQFGDMIELDFTEDMKNGKTKYHHLECKFHPALVEMLLKNEIITEKEVDDSIEYVYDDEDSWDLLAGALDGLIDTVKKLEEKIKQLEMRTKLLEHAVYKKVK